MRCSSLAALSAAFSLHLGLRTKQTWFNTSTSHATPAHFPVLRYDLGGHRFTQRKAARSGVSAGEERENASLSCDAMVVLVSWQPTQPWTDTQRLDRHLLWQQLLANSHSHQGLHHIRFSLHRNVIHVVFFKQPFTNASISPFNVLLPPRIWMKKWLHLPGSQNHLNYNSHLNGIRRKLIKFVTNYPNPYIPPLLSFVPKMMTILFPGLYIVWFNTLVWKGNRLPDIISLIIGHKVHCVF